MDDEKHRCTKCGCLWRLNRVSDGRRPYETWSLFDQYQKPCKECDNSPGFLYVIERVEAA